MKILKILFGLVMLMFLFGACKYDFIVPEEIPVVDPDGSEISFSTDILPIFNNGNNCTACHKTGGQAPDLTSGRAYNALNSARYINTTTPEDSRIYSVPDPGSSHYKKYTAAQAALVLGWISQGAKNN
ncbi:hypothetical protein SAMN06265379_101799 [Saccharicrinis carchari]|uniref:Cytochrome c domain-containing protein n=1 Tax=Saccharicrinis carchari TaxID=1168039 RepID=A0A521B971_SACCC|nr:cytochrome c [Saccharicrinis carchari]SMO43637.1 hypothetical protein SAMN06265379_101799 [Saccharicrinis carchari]